MVGTKTDLQQGIYTLILSRSSLYNMLHEFKYQQNCNISLSSENGPNENKLFYSICFIFYNLKPYH